ncbi:hypothetical protein HHK36_004709 [Tetracentron sinense]|uniref:Leucine-rich repeat-containing N-terminal plant-type domain-containing protein n=1 Tax=Tetracentron sinense TaxID=13715 RepID=A0A834ZN32_TETSI|nr:hypothetical protein HHK36_004709 [Tetracentron sinense]
MKMIGSCIISTHLLFLLLLLLGCIHLETIKPTSGNEDLNVDCAEKDRKVLLKFKEDLNDPLGWLSSWVGEYCCSWRGIGCNQKTGRVIKLDLRNPLCIYQQFCVNRSCLSGKINPSLLHLKHLNYLDLSLINFGETSILEFIGSLENLKYLNFSYACFARKIPPHLGNISRLIYLQELDLSDNPFKQGEMLVGPSKALFMDEISTGLDSSTTFQIVKFIMQLVHIMDVTMIVSLLQPAPETFDPFNDIILLSEGQIVYQGPCENILEYFEYMGTKCPKRKGVADFVQEVTSKKDQEQYWFRKNQPYRYISVLEFEQSVKSFHIGQQLTEDLRTPYDKTRAHPSALVKEKYGISNWELFKACFSRVWLLMKCSSFIYIFKTAQITIMHVNDYYDCVLEDINEAWPDSGWREILWSAFFHPN